MPLPTELLRLLARHPGSACPKTIRQPFRITVRRASNFPIRPRNSDQSTEFSSPFEATASIFGRIFRIAVFSSVTIVAGSAVVWGGTYLWVENISLGKALPLIHDEYAWDEADPDAWSGSHLGGGTDPRLSFQTRTAIRTAYAAQLAYSGNLSVINSGGHIIQSEREAMQVPDVGYLNAERCLCLALSQALEQGISLPDRAAIELEERLASVRERIAGKMHLAEARKGWERILKALQNEGIQSDTWEARQIARAARKMGEVSLRLANEALSPGSAQENERRRAEEYLLQSIKTSLGDHAKDLHFAHLPLALSTPEARKASPPAIRNIISASIQLVGQQASESLLKEALHLSEATLALARASEQPQTPDEPLSKTLHSAWIRSRIAALESYEAEIRRASKEAEEVSLSLLSSAVATAEAASMALLPVINGHSGFQSFKAALSGDAKAQNDARLLPRCLETDKDARTAASSASFLSGLIQELGANRKHKADYNARNQKAADFYVQALRYAAQISEDTELTGVVPTGKYADSPGFRKAWNAYVRVREKMHTASI